MVGKVSVAGTGRGGGLAGGQLAPQYLAINLFQLRRADYILLLLLAPPMYTRAQNVCPGWPVYEVKQPQKKWVCDFHDDAPPLSFQLQVAEVIF